LLLAGISAQGGRPQNPGGAGQVPELEPFTMVNRVRLSPLRVRTQTPKSFREEAMKKHTLALMLGACLLSGCAHVGVPFAWADVEELYPGTTSYTQAVRKLGEPAYQVVDEAGIKKVYWKSKWMVGYGILSLEEVQIEFDRNDKMMRIVSTTGAPRYFPY